MPRGRKSKLHTREKRCQTHGKAKRSLLLSSPPVGDIAQSSPAAGLSSTPQEAQKLPIATTHSKGPSCTSAGEAANSRDKEKSSSQAPFSTKSSRRDPLTRKVGLLKQFILHKFKMREPIMKKDMMKIVNQKYKDQFPEILQRASESIEVVFGVDVKEVDSTSHTYDLVSKMDLPNNGRVSGSRGLPKTGLLMTLLGMIFVKGNCATEKEIWKFLNMMHIYAGRKHFFYGEPQKLITGDLVKLKYLEYRRVPHSDPPLYEFLWGPRAKQETSKMKVLEFLAKVNNTVPGAFSSQYEEAMREEEERAQARMAARAGTHACPNEAPGPCPAAPLTPGEV
ncbi:melanoma-associated antigen B5-like [Dasypus novemcinctus]|uniref:melanoma-associated antigen B5-like n=1 Tax=Dasypus novemcinctus TaxID=9361 RepID=UPI00265F579B|nr:melanoma-associated antigen B5-like [Dasypus novemcinctus]